MGVVYAIHDGDYDFKYVGITVRTTEQRLASHKRAADNGAPWRISEWLRDHPNAVATVLCHAEIDDLHDAERWWYVELKELGYDLLNMTSGGQGTYGHVMSEETKERISRATTGKHAGKPKPLTPAGKAKLLATHKGIKRSAETRAKISAAMSKMKGGNRTEAQKAHQAWLAELSRQRRGQHTHSAETREKISKAHTGMKASEETKAKMREAHRRRKS
jgi:hypothetical protein